MEWPIKKTILFQSRSSSNTTIGTNQPNDEEDEEPQPQPRLGRAGSISRTRGAPRENSTPSTVRRQQPAIPTADPPHQPPPAQAAKTVRKVPSSPPPARRTLSPRKPVVNKICWTRIVGNVIFL